MNGRGNIESENGSAAADRGALRLKSYFAPAVEIAVAQARSELGPDALLVDSRPAPPEAAHLGRYEVVFAAGGAIAPEAETSPSGVKQAEPDVLASLSRISSQIEALSTVVLRKASQDLPPADSVCAREAVALLTECGFSRDTAGEIASAAIQRLGQRGGDEAYRSLRRLSAIGSTPTGQSVDFGSVFRAELESEIASRVRISPALGHGSGTSRFIALVGPSGAGKTTTIVKLAFQYGVRLRLPVQLLSLDTARIAGTDQLRECAAILGIGFQALSAPAALARAMVEHRAKALILIDTPGTAACDMGDAKELARVLNQPEIDTHLVVPASMARAAMRRVAERFGLSHPKKLIFSKADEIEDYGACCELALKTGLPVSFLSTGPRVPEDLAEATRDWLVGSLFRNWPKSAVSAA